VHPVLWALVQSGRREATSFDLQHAPLSAFLYSRLGDAHVGDAAAHSDRLFRGELDGVAFLRTQRPDLVRTVVEAASHIASTRREAIQALPLS
jgi:hypothetical protein